MMEFTDSDAKEVINYGPGLKARRKSVHEIVSQHLRIKIVSDLLNMSSVFDISLVVSVN